MNLWLLQLVPEVFIGLWTWNWLMVTAYPELVAPKAPSFSEGTMTSSSDVGGLF